MSELLLHVIISTFTMLVLDGLWIYFIMGSIYKETVQRVQNGMPMQLRTTFAVCAYILLAISLIMVIFSIHNRQLPTYKQVLIAAGWGAVIYGVYSFTVLSVFKDFPITTAFLDIAWGAILFATSINIPKVFF